MFYLNFVIKIKKYNQVVLNKKFRFLIRNAKKQTLFREKLEINF